MLEDPIALFDFLEGKCFGHRVTWDEFNGTRWSTQLITEHNVRSFAYIQPNRGGFLKWIPVKLDVAVNKIHDDRYLYHYVRDRLTAAGVSLPNFFVVNRSTQKVTLWYSLSTSIKLSGKSAEYAGAICRTISNRLGSPDVPIQGYAMSPWWVEHHVHQFHNRPMTLDEIRPKGPLCNSQPWFNNANDFLFYNGRKWAYEEVKSKNEVIEPNHFYQQLLVFLLGFDLTPYTTMDHTSDENRALCSIIANNILRYILDTYIPNRQRLRLKQSERGSQKGKAFRELYFQKVIDLYRQGMMPSKITITLPVKLRTIKKWVSEWRNSQGI